MDHKTMVTIPPINMTVAQLLHAAVSAHLKRVEAQRDASKRGGTSLLHRLNAELLNDFLYLVDHAITQAQRPQPASPTPDEPQA